MFARTASLIAHLNEELSDSDRLGTGRTRRRASTNTPAAYPVRPA